MRAVVILASLVGVFACTEPNPNFHGGTNADAGDNLVHVTSEGCSYYEASVGDPSIVVQIEPPAAYYEDRLMDEGALSACSERGPYDSDPLTFNLASGYDHLIVGELRDSDRDESEPAMFVIDSTLTSGLVCVNLSSTAQVDMITRTDSSTPASHFELTVVPPRNGVVGYQLRVYTPVNRRCAPMVP